MLLCDEFVYTMKQIAISSKMDLKVQVSSHRDCIVQSINQVPKLIKPFSIQVDIFDDVISKLMSKDTK